MKCAIVIIFMSVAVMRLGAQEKEEPHPDTAFRQAVQKIEHDFVTGMRQLASKATSVQVYQIGDLKPNLDPFTDGSAKALFKVQEGAYTILKTVDKIKNRETIRLWAEAVLPTESHPFAVCVPSPGFAVRFVDADGTTVYSTAICLKCQSAAMKFPRYSSRIGFDPKAMKRLLTVAGFSTAELAPNNR